MTIFRKDLSQSASAFSSVNCLIFRTGSVLCVPPTRHTAACKADLRRYPYDTQNCTVRYGSWVHTGEEVVFNIDKMPIRMDDYIPSDEWTIKNISVEKSAGKYKNLDNTYPSISYNFLIERRPMTQAATLIVPNIGEFLT